MNKIQEAISEAHKMLSSIYVNGNAVELMAGAKIHLKEAYDMAGDKSALWEAHKQADKPEKEKADG